MTDAETTTPQEKPPFWRKHRAVIGDTLASAAIVVIGVGGAALAWWWGGGNWFDLAALQTIGWVGALVSLAGVVIAVLIFRRQTRSAAEDNARQETLLDRIHVAVGNVDTKVSDLQKASSQVPDSEDASEGEVDEWAASTPAAKPGNVYVTSPTGRRRRVFQPADVPLAVVAALVSRWKEMGLEGKWTVGMLRGAFRAEGKGNHPWFLIFEPRRGEGVAWKVTRGPGGTDHAVELKSAEGWD